MLRSVLNSIRDHYRIRPADLDSKTAAAWYSTRGCQSAGMTPSETRDWIEHLFQYRGETLQALEAWIRQLASREEKTARLELPLPEIPVFLRALNDHRLFLAARHDLGEQEIALDYPQASVRLSTQQEAALFQVNFLAFLMEVLLTHLPNSGADWRDQCLNPDVD